MTQTGPGGIATPGKQGSQGSNPSSSNNTPRSSNAGGRGLGGDDALRAVADGFKSLGEALDHSHERTIIPKIEVKVCSKDDSESILLTLTSLENQASIGGYSKAFDGRYIERHLPDTEKEANELDPADKSNVEARKATRMNQCGVAVMQAAFGGLPGPWRPERHGGGKEPILAQWCGLFDEGGGGSESTAGCEKCSVHPGAGDTEAGKGNGKGYNKTKSNRKHRIKNGKDYGPPNQGKLKRMWHGWPYGEILRSHSGQRWRRWRQEGDLCTGICPHSDRWLDGRFGRWRRRCVKLGGQRVNDFPRLYHDMTCEAMWSYCGEHTELDVEQTGTIRTMDRTMISSAQYANAVAMRAVS
eukprot:scaffold69846_cov43-Cyclotella_meneghiniana.AAC.1